MAKPQQAEAVQVGKKEALFTANFVVACLITLASFTSFYFLLAPASRRGAAMGTFSTAMALGIGGGSVLWGFVAQAAGYQVMYLASGTVALLAFVVFAAGWWGKGNGATHPQ